MQRDCPFGQFGCRREIREGEAVAAQLRGVGSRLAGERAQRMFEVAGGTVISVVYGIIGTALAQGLLAGIGLALAGVPAAPLLGLAVFFLSIKPGWQAACRKRKSASNT